MDPKKQGIVFEALTYLALKDKWSELHWGEKPEGFSIDPDFVLGDLAAPSHWLLITSSGSAKEGDKKLWRNVAEIIAAKVFFATPPLVINLVFKMSQKQSLQDAMIAFSDADLRVLETSYGQTLIDFIDGLPETLPANNLVKVDRIRESLAKNFDATGAFDLFKKDLQKSLSTSRLRNKSLWSLIASHSMEAVAKEAKSTYARRGIGKLMVCTQQERQSLYTHCDTNRRLREADVPKFLKDLGFLKPAIGGYSLSDSEMRWAVSSLGGPTIERIISKSPIKRMQQWIDPLRAIERMDDMLGFVKANYTALCNPKKMLAFLQAIHEDPSQYLGKDVASSAPSVWLYFVIVDLLKAHSKKSQGFGYALLISRVKKNSGSIDSWLRANELGELNLRGQSVVVRGLTDWISRLETTHARSFSGAFQGAVAWVLSDELSRIPSKSLPSATHLKEMAVRTNLEQKLLTYRDFNPLRVLLLDSLKRHRIEHVVDLTFPTVVGELVGSPDRMATTTVILVGDTLIHWKSASKNPRDKAKELCGRAPALRVQFVNHEFQKRKRINRLVLVLDGSFTNSQLADLKKSGWDDIVYVDEIDAFVSALGK